MSSFDAVDRGEGPPTAVLDANSLRSVFAHALDGILLTVPDGRILAANPTACELFGYSEAELCAAGRAAVVVHDETAHRFLLARQRDGHARGVLTMRRHDGTTFLAEVSSSIFRDEAGELRTTVVFRDVTEHERSRRALAILADAGRVLSSSLDEATTLRHLTDLVVPKLADVCAVDLLTPTGVARVAIAHRDPARVADFVHVRRRVMNPHATAGVDFVLATGEPSCAFDLTDAWLADQTQDAAHFEAARKLGVRSFVSVPLLVGTRTIGALTLMSDGGVPTFTAADLPLVRALAERAAFAIDNAHVYAEAIEAKRLRDEVLGVVAHDLRTPLNTIQLAVTRLARSAPSAALDSIASSVHRANILIQDLLLATKAETGTIPLVPRVETLGTILEEVDAIHRPLAEAKELELVVAVDGDPTSSVVVDRHRVVQMLSNLLSNAIKFSSAPGRVTLRARIDAERLELWVADTGVGIPADDLPHIFDRYWQGKHARDLGAGLGLSISRSIAEAHGGTIAVDSIPGRGTTFTIELPVSTAARALTSMSGPAPEPATHAG